MLLAATTSRHPRTCPLPIVNAFAGRGIGELLGRNSRAYALIGGAGILGGITRMTLSVTVMMVEASGWVLFVIPLMLVFIVARSVGNRFNEGIYDTQIRIKKMPFLEQVSSGGGMAQKKGRSSTMVVDSRHKHTSIFAGATLFPRTFKACSRWQLLKN